MYPTMGPITMAVDNSHHGNSIMIKEKGKRQNTLFPASASADAGPSYPDF